MLNKGDKLVVVKDVSSFLVKGDIVKVHDVDDRIISFAFGNNFVHMGVMSYDECNKHFKKVEEKKSAPTVTQKQIDDILNGSAFDAKTVFDKCTIVTCKLPNGFVIVESAACVSPENYDEKMGFDICMKKIVNKIWELEGYKLQSELFDSNPKSVADMGNWLNDCDECDCCECDDYDEWAEAELEIEEVEECPCKCESCSVCIYSAPPCGETHFCN